LFDEASMIIQPVVIADAWKAENIYTLVGLNSFQSPKTVPHDFPIIHLRRQYYTF
jgi:hypothetical protein